MTTLYMILKRCMGPRFAGQLGSVRDEDNINPMRPVKLVLIGRVVNHESKLVDSMAKSHSIS